MYAPAVLPVVFAVKTADKSFQRRLIWEALLSGEEFRDLKDAGFDYVDGRGYVAKPTEKAKALIKKYQIHPTKTEAGGNENGQTSDIVTENQNRANTLRGQSETTSEANSNDKGKRQNETAEQKKQVEKQPEPKTEGTPQAQIQELEARIQKVQAQIQKLRRLKELIESNPANADEYIMELQSVAAEIMLEGDNPEAQALAQALTQQITALTQAVQPQQEKAEQPKQKVESVERKETAAAKDGENKKKPALAEGYTTESGRPLSEADEKEFILHDGEINFGMIDKTIADATGGELKEAPIRLQVGNTGMGLIHAKKHNDDAVRAGFKSIEDFIADVAANFDRIYKRANQTGNDTYILVKMGDGSAGVAHSTAPIYFEVAKDKGGGFYNIITAIPKGDRGLKKGIKKELLVYSRPVLDSAAISNDSAVSNQGSNNVGATQENVPTSDSTSNSSKAIISQEASESKAKEREAVTTQENEREQEAEQPTAKPTSAWWENIKKNLASRLANSKVKSSSKYYDKNGNIVFEMVRKHLSTKQWMNEHPKMIDAALQAIKGDENTIRIIERLSALQQAAVVDAIENGMENYGFSKEEADKVRKYQIGGITTKRQHALEDLIKEIRAIADENEDKDTKQASENIANGKKAIQKIIDTHETVENAMFREDVGNIDFVWGEEGHGAKFKGGYGIAHIIAKRNAENGSGLETANKLVEVIAKGKDKERQESDNNAGEPRLKIHYDGYTAVLSLKDADKNTWLLTGWEDGKNNKKAAASANGEGYDSTTATTATPTLTRRNGETAASNKSISQEAKGSNQQSNESSAEQQAAEASAAVKKPKPDKNGVVPIYANNHNRYFEGEELDKVREDNTKAIMKAAQAIADKYDKGELSASEAKTQITALYKHYYSKAKVKPYTDDLQERINLLKKEISAKKQEAEQSSNRQKQQKAEEIKAEKEATEDIVTKAAKTVEGDPSEVEALDDKTRDALNEALTEDDLADLEGAATDSELDKDADAGRKELEAVILVDFATEGKLDDGFNERLKKLEKYFADEKMPFESTRAAMQKYGRLLIRTLAAAEDTFVKAGGITTRGYEVAIASNEKARRSHKEILNDMRDALPNGSFERQDNGDYEISMPNGAKIGLNIKDRIIVNASEEAQAKASHGINQKEGIVIEGSWERLTGKMLDGFLNLSRESRKGTAFHEVFHAAWDLALTEREQSALLKYFTKKAKEQGSDVYEVMADAYADWELARRRERSSIFGKLWQKIKDFARRLRDAFTGMDNLHGIMQQIESGKVWEESLEERQKREDVIAAINGRETIVDAASRGDIQYAVNQGVDPERQVEVVNLNGLVPQGIKTVAQLAQFVKGLAQKQAEVVLDNPDTDARYHSADGEIAVRLVDNKRYNRHFANSLRTIYRQSEHILHNAAINNIKDLINKAVLIESIPNNKTAKKPNIKAYHRLYVPIEFGNPSKFYTMRIVVEESVNSKTAKSIDVALYDIVAEKDSNNKLLEIDRSYLVEAHQRVLNAHTGNSYAVSILNMLRNVKDSSEINYVDSENNLRYSETEAATKEDADYFKAIRNGDIEEAQRLVNEKAAREGFADTIPEQTKAYNLRTGAAPKKTVKVYKVFTVAPDGSPTALFVAGTEKLPQGVWLDAVDTCILQAKTGMNTFRVHKIHIPKAARQAGCRKSLMRKYGKT